MDENIHGCLDGLRQRLCVAALIIFKGDDDMMAMLWAQQIILGKKTFAQVPRMLREQVKEILIDRGCEELVKE